VRRLTGIVILLASAAPAGADGQRLLLFADRRPVVLDLPILVDGKPSTAAAERYFDRLFADLDRDGDGRLSPAEAARAPDPDFVTSFVQGNLNLEAAARVVPFGDLDADHDGSVSRDEFRTFYRRCGLDRVRVVPGPEREQARALTSTLFRLLDRDGDGKLSRDELKQAREALHRIDLDEDEWITPEEVLLHRPEPGAVERHRVTPAELGVQPLEGASLEAHRQALRARYPDRTGDPASLAVTVRLGPRPMSAPAVERLSSGGEDAIPVQRIDEGCIRLNLSGLAVDVQAGTGGAGRVRGLHAYYRQQFAAADPGRRGFVEVRQVEDTPALAALFRLADRDGDGKLTAAEFDAFLNLHALGAESNVTLTVTDQSPGLFELLDEDGDSRLSLRELYTARERLAGLDRDGDGRLGADELPRRVQLRLTLGTPSPRPAAGPRTPAPASGSRGPAWFRRMDRNGDGYVSRREFLGSLEDFRKLDVDGDGLISPEEAARYEPSTPRR
jgi:Ca2+-binding EF-hand superfamily protein